MTVEVLARVGDTYTVRVADESRPEPGPEPEPANAGRFSDVPDDAWYLGYVERLADLGVVEPYEDGTFRPYEPLTRLDMAASWRAYSPRSARWPNPRGYSWTCPPTPKGRELWRASWRRE